jgi:hypothetical protein
VGRVGPGPAFTVLPDTFDFFSGIDQRVAVALADSSGTPITPSDGPVTIQIATAGGAFGSPQPAAVHNVGIPPYVLSSYRFPAPGNYTIRVGYARRTEDLAVTVIPTSATQIPTVGGPLISVATPTTAAPGGVNPVCTRQPPCPFHTVSLDAALAQHRPIALQFATPALCQSRLCGPVVDNLMAARTALQTPTQGVAFIHCEIYTDLSGQTSVPAVTAYHLEHEPLLFLAGPDGIVRERLDNGYDQVEAVSALQRLVA